MKKFISICLTIILLCSVAILPASANNGEKAMHTLEQAMTYWEETLDCEIPTRTLYFYFRDDWKFESNDYYDATVGLDSCLPAVYWYGNSTGNPDDYPFYGGKGWPGYILTEMVAPNVFKAEIPANAEIIVFNNGIDSATDRNAMQTVDLPLGYEDHDPYYFYPNGISKENFVNMIFVPDYQQYNSFMNQTVFDGAWFYYYGDGQYGYKPANEEIDAIFANGDFPVVSTDIDPTETVPDNIQPTETSPTETVPGNTDPTETQPVSTEPVEELKTTITLEKTSAKLYIKENAKINVTVTNGRGETTYTSNNPKVAKVNANGIIKAKKAGTATITVTNNGVSEIFKVIVKKPELNKDKTTISIGNKEKLKIKGQVGKATFKSSNTKVAKVNANGKITAKSKGKTTITVKTNGMTLKCKVTVKK